MALEPDLNERRIDAFLQNDVLLKMLFAWIRGIQYNLPNVSQPKLIDQFYRYFNLSEETFIKKDSALREIYRVDAQIRQSQKSSNASSDQLLH